MKKPLENKKKDRFSLKSIYSEELKTIISTNLVQERTSISNKLLLKENLITRVTKFFVPSLPTINTEINEEEESQRKYQIAKRGWQKVRKHYLAFLFLKKETVFMGFTNIDEKRPLSYQRLVLQPHSNIIKIVDFVKSFFILYLFIMIPFRYFFDKIMDPDYIMFVYVDIVMDFFFLMEIFLNFFKAIIGKGRVITSFKLVAWSYIRSTFLIDLISIFPYYLFNEKFYALKFFRYVQINFVLTYQDNFYSFILSKITPNFNFVKSFTSLLRFSLILVIVAQFCSCYWYNLGIYPDGWIYNKLYPVIADNPLICPQNENCINGWVMDLYTMYITSIYWALETMVTLGYGDLTSHRTSELLFSMLVEFLGVFVFAYLMGNINTLIEKLDDDTLEYLQDEEEKLDKWLMKLDHANPKKKLLSEYVARLKKHLLIHWSKDHSSIINEYPFFNQLPFSLKNELMNTLFGKFIKDFHIFFRGTEVQFVHEVIVNLTPKKFTNKTEIIKKGKTSDFLYFLVRGFVSIGSNEGIVKYLDLVPGSFFGEHLILFNLKSSNSFVATSHSEVLCMCLEKNKLKEICKTYPKSYYVVKQKALLRRAYIRNSKHIVEEEIKSNLSETLSKRSLSFKQKRRKEKEKLNPKSQSVGGEGLSFALHLLPVEVDEFEKENSVAFEKSNESFKSLREMPDARPGHKMLGKPIELLKKKLSDASYLNISKSFIKERTDKPQPTHINDDLDKELQDQKVLQRMLNLKNQLEKLNKGFMNFSKEIKKNCDVIKKDLDFIKYDWEHRIFE